MFDQTSKIAAINSFHEPETGTYASGQKRRPQPKHAAQSTPSTELPDSDRDRDEHELDTLA